MGQVNVSINDRSYTVACGDGEEEHLRELARYLDGHVADLAKSVGQVGDARLLLLAGLLIADEYADALDQVKQLKRDVAELTEAREQETGRTHKGEEAVAALLGQATARIEKMAQRLEGS